MNPQRQTVFVSASFAEKEGLHAWLKKYGKSWDDRFIYWEEFAFTPYPLNDADAILVFNTPSETIRMLCGLRHTIAFMMEPGIPDMHPWMFRRLLQYGQVYSHLPQSTNTVLSHSYLGWYPEKTFSELNDMMVPEKKLLISCIASLLKQLPGHRLRLGFVEMLKKEIPSIDFFGKGSHYLDDKLDGLLPYRYSIAIENAALPYYFTEKINDCFLGWCVPIYHGCSNIGKFFPARSFIRIDIRDPRKALHCVRDVMENDDWSSRLAAIGEARQLVLEKYQPLAGAASILRQVPHEPRTEVLIEPVKRTFLEKWKGALHKMV